MTSYKLQSAVKFTNILTSLYDFPDNFWITRKKNVTSFVQIKSDNSIIGLDVFGFGLLP